MSDASANGLGRGLLQKNKNGLWDPISFTSCQLQTAYLAYADHEKEFLAVVHVLKKWRHYQHGENFEAAAD